MTYDFSQVDALIHDSQTNMGRLIRDALVRYGMPRAETFTTLSDLKTALAGGAADLLIVDGDAEDGAGLTLIQDLRRGELVRNPFVVIIATTWTPTGTLVMRATNAGADDLLVKPCSPRQIADRITVLIDGRKPFVVTSDYVGPDRRKQPRPGGTIPLIDAPNTLRWKATGAKLDAETAITEATRRVSAEKLVRHTVQAAFLIDFARPGLQGDGPRALALDHLERLPGVIEAVLRRAVGDRHQGQIEQSGRAMLAQIHHVRQRLGAPEGLAEELGKLRAFAANLMQAARPDTPPEDLTCEKCGGEVFRRFDDTAQPGEERAEFESLLGVADGRDLAALSLVDRRTMDEVVD